MREGAGAPLVVARAAIVCDMTIPTAMRAAIDFMVSPSRWPGGDRSRLRLVGRPVVGFLGRVAAPAKKGVVEQHARAQLFQVVVVHARKAERRGQKSGS